MGFRKLVMAAATVLLGHPPTPMDGVTFTVYGGGNGHVCHVIIRRAAKGYRRHVRRQKAAARRRQWT